MGDSTINEVYNFNARMAVCEFFNPEESIANLVTSNITVLHIKLYSWGCP